MTATCPGGDCDSGEGQDKIIIKRPTRQRDRIHRGALLNRPSSGNEGTEKMEGGRNGRRYKEVMVEEEMSFTQQKVIRLRAV